jgi:hypothetical protein
MWSSFDCNSAKPLRRIPLLAHLWWHRQVRRGDRLVRWLGPSGRRLGRFLGWLIFLLRAAKERAGRFQAGQTGSDAQGNSRDSHSTQLDSIIHPNIPRKY